MNKTDVVIFVSVVLFLAWAYCVSTGLHTICQAISSTCPF
jgi:hypothetical protein